jgi:hypothetical protein
MQKTLISDPINTFFFFTADNKMAFGATPAYLSELTLAEELIIARVRTHTEVHQICGGHFKYKGHVCFFLREVGLLYRDLPRLPAELDIVVLRDPNPRLDGTRLGRYKVRRGVVQNWLLFLKENHPGYRSVNIDEARLSQLPENGTIFNQLPNQIVTDNPAGIDDDISDADLMAMMENEAASAVPDLHFR